MILVWLLASCNSQIRYHQFQHINNEAWQLGDTVIFDIPLTDSIKCHELTLQLRHTSKYPYLDLAIGMVIFSPDSQVTESLNYNKKLVDQEGYWIGNGQGGFYQIDIGETSLPQTKSGTWHFHIFHTMNDSILIGVNDIGVRVMSYDQQTPRNK